VLPSGQKVTASTTPTAAPARSRRADPSRRRATRLWAVRGIAAAAAVGGLLAAGEPTGLHLVDALWRAALAAVVTLAASRSRRWPLFVLSGCAAALGTGLAQVLGIASLALAFWSLRRRRADRVLDAVIGALAVQALLRLPTTWPARTSALVVAVCAALVCGSAWRFTPDRSRRHIVVGALVLGAVTLVAAMAAGLAAFSARSRVASALADTRAAVAAARDGESEQAGAFFASAATGFGDAHDSLGAWYAAPAGWVPGLGHQVRALEVATGEGEQLAATAAGAAQSADVQGLHLVDGRVDLGLVSDLRDPLTLVATMLDRASGSLDDLDGTWLVPPLADRVDALRDEVASGRQDAAVARDTIERLPGLLGADGPRRYLVVFTTPSETRGAGGFIGAFAELTAVDGHLEMTRNGTIGELVQASAPPARLTGPPDYLAQYAGYNVGRYPQNATASPDVSEVGQVLAELYPQAPGGQPVDGVVVVDPYALAAILEVTGPVAVAGLDEPLTADNAVELLLREQYFRFDPSPDTVTAGTEAREDFLEAATRATFDALTTRTTTPSPTELVDTFGPVSRQRRLAAYSALPDEQGFFRGIGLDGAFPRARGGDLLAVTHANGAANKLDGYLHRSIDYKAAYDPGTGEVEATATVRLENTPPDGPLPLEVGGPGETVPPGTNRSLVTLYSPLDLTRVDQDGTETAVGVADQFGLHAYTVVADIPRGGAVTFTFALKGAVDPGTYRLQVVRPALANPDALSVMVAPAGKARLDRAHGLTIDGDQATTSQPAVEDDRAYSVTFADS
jgi:hypothetical protein